MLPASFAIHERPCHCRVGDAVEAICVPEWEIASGSHDYDPVESNGSKSPWKFRRSAVPGRVTAVEIVWIRES
ncbi:hypothetical protein [Luteolibacter soli]|uniref:Uncharacterized protein n=1 Tax=Luteolibacter soli TaxID=3135280 RepID=A0ABU9AQN7_9BACT